MICLNASLTQGWLRNCCLQVFKYVPVIFQLLITVSSLAGEHLWNGFSSYQCVVVVS